AAFSTAVAHRPALPTCGLTARARGGTSMIGSTRGHARALRTLRVSVFGAVAAVAVVAAVGVQGAETLRVSVDSAGGQADDASIEPPSISRNGRWVAFSSLASNLVTGDTAGQSDVFVHDVATGTTTRVSVGSAGPGGQSYQRT